MGATFLDKKGKSKPVVMGCYGIGLGRLMAGIVEAHHDKKGICWPESVAPFKLHLVDVNQTRKQAAEIYQKLVSAGVEVLWDDRQDVSAGVKFADADLIGIPHRLVISEKTFQAEKIEWKKRDSVKTSLLTFKETLQRFSQK